MKTFALLFIGACVGSLGLLWTAIFCKAHETAQIVDYSTAIGQVQSSIETLNARLDQIDQAQLKLNTNLASLHDDQANLWQQFFSQDDQTSQVDMTGQGYSSVKTQFGTLVIACLGVEPYLDGQRIRLEVGNPLNATFNGFKLGVDTGRRPMAGGHVKHQDIDFVDKLLPGQFTEVSFVVAPATPDEVGCVAVSISLNQIALHKLVNE